MTPDDVAGFASRVSLLSDGQIDRIYQFAVRVRQDAVPMTPTSVIDLWRSLETNGRGPVEDEASCDLMLDVSVVGPGANLGDKIFQIFEAANVAIITTSSAPSPLRPASPDSVESIDENDPRWQQAVALDRRRLASQALVAWNDQKNDLRAEYEAFENPAANQLADSLFEKNLARKTSDLWLARTRQHQDMTAKADRIRFERDAGPVLHKWALAARESILFRARQQALGRKVLDKWRQKALESRERRALAEQIEARQQTLAIKYFQIWRTETQKSKAEKYNAAYKTMRRKIKMNIARAVLKIWREKTRRIIEMRETADALRVRREDEHARQTAHSAIVTMYNQQEKTRELEQQADEVYNKNLVDRLGLFGSAWLEPTRQIIKNQNIADDYRQTREASHASGVLRDWRNAAFRAQRLEEDAEALRQRREREKALALLQKWRAAAAKSRNENGYAVENTLIPATPAARRSQLLASTTPAYTPATGLFKGSNRLIEEDDYDQEEHEQGEGDQEDEE